MDPIFRVVPPPKNPSCAHPAHACFIMLWMPMCETFVMKHMSVDQEVSLEVAQAKFGFAAPYSGVLYARTLCVVIVSRLICMVGEIIIFTLQL